jgi:non-ribosomal peptide synthetase-like protein
MPGRVAVEVGPKHLTYRELDRLANQLAHLLRSRGLGEGSRVGILLERSVETYIALLGVLKSGAAYIPLDHSFPDERLAYIATDAQLDHLVTTSASHERTRLFSCLALEMDQMQPELAAQSDARPCIEPDPASLCYVIYTSGSTGKPKGVAVSHASIVNFLRVATPIYNVTCRDRVYQGMSISFDFHLEEIWPAWVGGATLIAGPTDSNRFGQGLADFLTEHQATVLCSVPTLLTTVEAELPSVHTLLMSGEAVPPDLVRRFARPGRRILNCYGPTETTVSSSCSELLPDRPVTLGVPFPTYEFYILDDHQRPVEPGQAGEICIGGPGVAVGYLNRPELTAERFIPNPVVADRGRAPRIYRTGDLGRRMPTGEFEYLGRIDTQVKVRGYRIELGEIEQVIREDRVVENSVVVTTERGGVVADLVGYVTVHAHGTHNGSSNGADHSDLRERLHTTLRRRLPPYMIPSYIEVLDRFPLLAADKVDRARLPAPVSPPLGAGSGPHAPPETAREAEIAATWGKILGLKDVSVEADFFCDLGGHSMTAARVISALRERPGLQSLSMGDLYANPTVRDLADYVETTLTTSATGSAVGTTEGEPPAPLLHSNIRVLSCGVAQMVILWLWLLILGTPGLLLAYAVQLRLNIFAVDLPREGPVAAVASLGILPLALLCIGWFGIVLTLLPVVGSRMLMRGVEPGWYPLWGRTYLRFWFLGKVLALSPLGLFAGSPMLPPYLRLLGAKVGERCQLITSLISVPNLVEIGDGASIGFGTRVQSYVVRDGWLRLAPIRIGTDSFVGNNSVILPGAEIGDGASVGDQSLLHSDHRIPPNEHWAGSPIARLKAAPPLLQTLTRRADDRPWRPSVLFGYVAAAMLLRLLPLLMAIPGVVVVIYVTDTHGVGWGLASSAAAAPLYVVFTCVVIVAAKRAVMPRVEPAIYPARGGFGLRQWLSNHIVLLSVSMVSTVYCTLYAIPFLRWLGLRLGRWSEVATPTFIDPDTTVIGDQTFLAGGVVTGPSTYHRGCIAVATAEMGSRSFLGNEALLPCGSRMGENSLLGVFSVPPSRPMDPETTWLGSPAFFLPRREPSRRFPAKYIDQPTPGLIAGRLVIEYFRVASPEIIFLMTGLFGIYVMAQLAVAVPPVVLIALLPVLVLGFGLVDTLVVAVLKWIIMGRYRPRTEPYWGLWVRGTELITGLFEAVAVRGLLSFLTGTPWIAPALRVFGTHIGRRVWLNSTSLTEFDLVHIGDDAAIGEQGDMLTHLFEDRVMKMSHVRIGARSTVGTRSVVLYDAEVGTDSFLDAYSLVMKGEVLPPQTRWRGIPARPL